MRRFLCVLVLSYAGSVAYALAVDARTAADGKAVYVKTCAACHALGTAGAPKLSDKAAWKERVAGGRAGLMLSVLRGKGNMPPKGGNASVSDADASAALEYILRQVE